MACAETAVVGADALALGRGAANAAPLLAGIADQHGTDDLPLLVTAAELDDDSLAKPVDGHCERKCADGDGR